MAQALLNSRSLAVLWASCLNVIPAEAGICDGPMEAFINIVMPAEAGIHLCKSWTPAFAGVTGLCGVMG